MSVHFKKIVSQTIPTRLKFSLDGSFSALALSDIWAPFQKAPTGRYLSPMFIAMLFGALLCCPPSALSQETNQQFQKPKIIVLDPGHGGLDRGASGPENVIEKDIVMTFVRAMTKRLKTSFRIILTRKDDYQVSLFDRTATANHHQADLFVCIHTGASYRSNPRGISVFYYEGTNSQPAGGGIQDDNQAETSQTIRPWEQQRPHLTSKSRYFAKLLQKRLSAVYQDLKFSSGGAPLVVLAGARMPAVLIEIGYVTNPMDAKSLSDDAWITQLAGHVCNAIDDFFSNNLRL